MGTNPLKPTSATSAIAGLAVAALWPVAASAETGSWQEHRAAVAALCAGNYGDAEAWLLDAIDRAKSCEPLRSRALEITRETLGAEHPDVAANLGHLGRLYAARSLEHYGCCRPRWAG